MSDRNGISVVLVTAPEESAAEELARRLLDDRLVACANIVPRLTSLYWWKGELERSQETLIILKARREDVDAIVERVRELHPYEVPEVIAMDIVAGLEDYLSWVRTETER